MTLTKLSQLIVIAQIVDMTSAYTMPQRSAAFSATINYSYDYSSLVCPDASIGPESTLITPTYGSSGSIFTICAALQIFAPASQIRDAILDFHSYGKWNTFIPSVTLPENVTETPDDDFDNMSMSFTSSGLVDGVNTTSTEILTILDYADIGQSGKPYLMVAWHYDDGLAGVGSRAEHPSVIVEEADGSSWMLSYETYYVGTLTPVVELLKDRLQEQFEVQAANLKAYVEGLS
ncbi:hypothetical protein GGR57DRAFT_332395 [Xylariaceae sp. FL1272]|nr:hypothetical protein GGR57DRAFT_332395 [Xylariaceae sp. FL1272]